MTTPFRYEHVFRAPSVRAIVDAYWDAEHAASQDVISQLGDRVVVEDHEVDGVRKTAWRVASLRPLPVFVRPFVAGGRLSFVETMTWRRATDAVEMTVAPEILGGRVQIAGAYELVQVGEQAVRRIYRGTITAALRLVGGKIERGILDAFDEQMPAMAACTQTWLDRRYP